MATAEYAEVPPAAAVVISGAGEEGEDANGAYAARVVWEGPKLPLCFFALFSIVPAISSNYLNLSEVSGQAVN